MRQTFAGDVARAAARHGHALHRSGGIDLQDLKLRRPASLGTVDIDEITDGVSAATRVGGYVTGQHAARRIDLLHGNGKPAAADEVDGRNTAVGIQRGRWPTGWRLRQRRGDRHQRNPPVAAAGIGDLEVDDPRCGGVDDRLGGGRRADGGRLADRLNLSVEAVSAAPSRDHNRLHAAGGVHLGIARGSGSTTGELQGELAVCRVAETRIDDPDIAESNTSHDGSRGSGLYC